MGEFFTKIFNKGIIWEGWESFNRFIIKSFSHFPKIENKIL